MNELEKVICNDVMADHQYVVDLADRVKTIAAEKGNNGKIDFDVNAGSRFVRLDFPEEANAQLSLHSVTIKLNGVQRDIAADELASRIIAVQCSGRWGCT